MSIHWCIDMVLYMFELKNWKLIYQEFSFIISTITITTPALTIFLILIWQHPTESQWTCPSLSRTSCQHACNQAANQACNQAANHALDCAQWNGRVLNALEEKPETKRRFHMAVLFRRDGTFVIRFNKPSVCCAERRALFDNAVYQTEHEGDETKEGILMFVIQVRCKKTTNGLKFSFGNSQPCQRCCRALRQSTVKQVVYSTHGGFHCCAVRDLPHNDYCALAWFFL